MLITIILAAILSTGVTIDTGSKKLQPQVADLVKDAGPSEERVVQTLRNDLQTRLTASFTKATNGQATLRFFWATKVVTATADAVVISVSFDGQDACFLFVRRGTEWQALPETFIP